MDEQESNYWLNLDVECHKFDLRSVDTGAKRKTWGGGGHALLPPDSSTYETQVACSCISVLQQLNANSPKGSRSSDSGPRGPCSLGPLSSSPWVQ